MTPPSTTRRALFGGLLAAGLGGGAAAADEGLFAPGLHDLMPDFWRFYDAGQASGDAAQRGHDIDQQFVAPNAAVYFAAGFGRNTPHAPVTDRRVSAWLADFDPMADAVRSLSETFPSAWAAHTARFKSSFPAFRETQPVFAMISFGEFDGHLQSYRHRSLLFFGLDGVVKYHGDKPDLAVLLDHEVFHLYHRQVNPELAAAPDNSPLWMSVWCEGLATYASERLNPDASTRAVLLDDQALVDADRTTVRRIAGEVLSRMNTRDPANGRRYLGAGYAGDIPARSGYLVGLRVCQHAGRSLSLDQLARLPAPKAKAFLHEQLSHLAHA